MGPSSFQEKDLDDEAEEFIVNWAQEFPKKTSCLADRSHEPASFPRRRPAVGRNCCASLFWPLRKTEPARVSVPSQRGHWWPVLSLGHLYEKLCRMRVEVRKRGSKGHSTRWGRSGVTVAWMN